MKTIYILILNVLFFAGIAQAAGPSQIFLNAQHDASFTVKKTKLSNGTFSYQATANTPTLLDVRQLMCTASQCNFTLVLKKNGPVNFDGYNISKNTPYGYATIVSPALSFDMDICGFSEIVLNEAYTYPTTNPSQRAGFVPTALGNAVTSVQSVSGNEIIIGGWFQLYNMLPNATSQYQTFQIIGAGIKYAPLRLVHMPTEFNVADGNKGTSTITTNYVGKNWLVNGWNTGSGHYAAVRLFTNGASEEVPGLNLSGYNTVTVIMSCQNNVVVEAFIGNADFDSSQAFVGDIACDGQEHTYAWNISAYNRSKIQTGLFLHIPVWKNTETGAVETISSLIKSVTFSQ